MSNFMKNIFSFLFIAILAVGVSAQQKGDSEIAVKSCGNFKMPIIIPPDDFDSLIIIKPDSNQNSKIISINPCGEIENTQTEVIQNTPLKVLLAPKK